MCWVWISKTVLRDIKHIFKIYYHEPNRAEGRLEGAKGALFSGVRIRERQNRVLMSTVQCYLFDCFKL